MTTPSGVTTDPLNLDPQVQQAYRDFYILDYGSALSRFEKIEAGHPDDPMAVDYVLETIVFRELYRLDLLDTTFYAHDGFLTGKHVVEVDPAVEEQVNSLIQQAISLSNARLKADPADADSYYARGWARSLDAVYMGLVSRGFAGALRVALEARSDDEKVLQLKPEYVDAELVVGIHDYVVGSLPLGFKILAGLAGIKGSKSRGISELRDDGARGVITSVEARTALTLFLRREAEYPDAISIAGTLKREYPRDFLFWLEIANLTKDSGKGPQAITEYRNLLKQAGRPGYFPSAHLELAWFGLAETLRGQRQYAEAAVAYSRAATEATTSKELKSRCQLNAGESYDVLKQRNKAIDQYQDVLLDGPGSSQANLARKYLKSPFSGN